MAELTYERKTHNTKHFTSPSVQFTQAGNVFGYTPLSLEVDERRPRWNEPEDFYEDVEGEDQKIYMGSLNRMNHGLCMGEFIVGYSRREYDRENLGGT